MNTFGSYIKVCRQQLGLTQDELAAGIVTKGMISQIELGKTYPSDDLLTKLAPRLQVSLDELRTLREGDQMRQFRYKHAEQAYEQGQYQTALELFEDCVADPHPNWNVTELEFGLVKSLLGLGRCQEARTRLENMVLRGYVATEIETVVRAYHLLGDLALRCENQPEVALEEWKRALCELETYPRKVDAAPQAVEICLQMAQVHTLFGELQEAFTYYEQADRWVRSLKTGASLKKAEVQIGYASVCTQAEEFKKAKGYLKRAYSNFEHSEDRDGMLRVRVQEAVLLRKKGDLGGATSALVACWAEVEEQGDERLLADLLLEQAICWQLSGKYDQALSALEWAMGLLSEQRREVELLEAQRLMGSIYTETGEYERASFWGENTMKRMQHRTYKRGYGKLWDPVKPISLRTC